jgi:hypothetical protein
MMLPHHVILRHFNRTHLIIQWHINIIPCYIRIRKGNGPIARVDEKRKFKWNHSFLTPNKSVFRFNMNGAFNQSISKFSFYPHNVVCPHCDNSHHPPTFVKCDSITQSSPFLLFLCCHKDTILVCNNPCSILSY